MTPRLFLETNKKAFNPQRIEDFVVKLAHYVVTRNCRTLTRALTSIEFLSEFLSGCQWRGSCRTGCGGPQRDRGVSRRLVLILAISGSDLDTWNCSATPRSQKFRFYLTARHAILWFFPVPSRKVLFSSLLESPTHVRARTPYYPVRKRTYSVTIQHRPFRT